MSKSKGSPRKFSEKIALLNKKEAEATAEFEKILKEVEATTRAPPQPPPLFHHHEQQQQQQKQYWGLPTRSSSFSNWHTSSHAQQSHVHQQNHSHFLAEPVQFNGNHQLHQHQQSQQQQHQQQQHHQQQQQPQQQRQQQHQQQQGQHIDCATRLRHTIYIDNQQEQHNRVNYQSSAQQQQHHQQHLQRQINQIDVIDGHVQPRPIDVPNIEIFPIDDDRSYPTQQQQQVTSATDTTDCLTNGHFHHDSSNSPISSARSLPNIANLSVSPSSSCIDTNGQFSTQTLTSQPLMPVVTSTANDSSVAPDQPTSIVTAGDNSPDNYAHSSTNDYFSSNDEYCSLPTIHEPISTNNSLDQNGQNRTHISRTNSWQHVVTSSAPSSAAPTPPAVYQQQSVHSPNSSSHSQQHSPQNLHQNYYPTTSSVQSQGQMVRASSTNFINNDLLEAPRMNNNLSKSTDAYYGYLDDYNANDTYFDGGLASGADNNFDSTGVRITTNNSLMRSGNDDIDNIPIQNDCKQTNQCNNTTQQQFSNAPQYQFYG